MGGKRHVVADGKRVDHTNPVHSSVARTPSALAPDALLCRRASRVGNNLFKRSR